MTDSIKEMYTSGKRLLYSQDYDHALLVFQKILEDEPDYGPALLGAGRANLALEQHDDAVQFYDTLLAIDYPQGTAEANLVLDKLTPAFKIFKTVLKNDELDNEAHFLFSVCCYKAGLIPQASKHLAQALELGFEWEDEDPIDAVVQQALPAFEFFDFEQLYLDAESRLENDNESPQNRWMHINMPIYEFFAAGSEEKQKRALNDLSRLLEYKIPTDIPAGSRETLKLLLEDFAASEDDASFGLEGLKLLDENKSAELSKMMLAMVLEHLEQFSKVFEWDEKFVQESDLQTLIPILPQPIALAILVLYSANNPSDLIMHQNQVKPSDELIIELIAKSFTAFYYEVERIKQFKEAL